MSHAIRAPGLPVTPRDHARERARLLRLLEGRCAVARLAEGRAVVYGRPGAVTLRVGSVPAVLIAELESSGALERTETRSGPEYRLSAAGKALARRQAMGAGPDSYAGQHYVLAPPEPNGDKDAPPLVNEAESPLLWLYRRRGKTGAGLIGDAEFAAGERLRADITRARMMPRLTADWERPSIAGLSVPSGLNASEAAVAAKQRVDKALAALGPEFSGLVVDICGFLKSIELIERERGWPARSAKVVLVLALQRLARHYGYAGAAQGPGRSKGVRGWGAADYRPTFEHMGASAHERAPGVRLDPLDHGRQTI